MYSQYWNLHCQPFENDADPTFFFRSRTHQAALLKLKYLIDANKGCGLLVGSSGAGKSYVTRLLIEELGVASPAELKEIDKKIKKEIEAAAAEALKDPDPAKKELFTDIYTPESKIYARNSVDVLDNPYAG